MHWRKAVAISMLLHGVVLTGAGWMAGKTSAIHEVPEQYIELELVTESASLARITDNIDSGSTAVNNKAVTTAISEPISKVAVASKEYVSSVRASASSMSVLSAETGGNSNVTEASTGQEKGGTIPAAVGTGKNMDAGADSGAGKSGKGGGISSPGILSRVEPTYPEQARQTGQQGTVVLKIQILASGRPGQVNVYHSSGSDLLDEAAINAVRQWRFMPATDRDSSQPIVCYTTIPVVFKLNT